MQNFSLDCLIYRDVPYLLSAIRPWRVTLVYVCVLVPTDYSLVCMHREF